MADQKISQLTEVTNPNPNDVIPIVNGSETKKITVANLAVAGSSGTSGSNGSSGTSGNNGSSGTSGSNGSSGTSGSNGSSGTSGFNGSSGTSGENGTSGSSGTSGESTLIITSSTQPTGKPTGSLWFNTNDGTTYIYYEDANSTNWVPTNPTLSGSSGTSGTSGVNGTSGSSGTSGNGTSGSSGTSGNGTSGTSGSSGIGVSASYMRGSRSTQQTSGLTTNSLVVFTQSDNSAGSDISLNTSTGQITLAANRTYRLKGMVPNFATSGGDVRPQFCWYNETSAAFIGSSAGAYVPSSAAAYGTFYGPSEAVITTNATTVVSFRFLIGSNSLTSIGGSGDFSTTGSYPWFDIEVISGYSPIVNGTSGTSGTSGSNGSSGTSGSNGSSGTSGTSPSLVGYAITGSNVFNGNQTITGSLNVSGSINITNGSVTMPERPAFRVTGAGGATAATTVLSGSMTNVDYNQGNAWNNSNGTFTAPIAGLYQVNLVVRCAGNSNPSAQVIVYKNNTTTSPSPNGTAQVMLEWAANTTANHIGGSTITKLAAGDTLKAIVTVGTISFDGNDNFSVAYIG